MNFRKGMAIALSGATVFSLAACGSNSGSTSSSASATKTAESAASTSTASEASTADSGAEEYPQEADGSVVTLKFNFVKSSADPEYQWYA